MYTVLMLTGALPPSDIRYPNQGKRVIICDPYDLKFSIGESLQELHIEGKWEDLSENLRWNLARQMIGTKLIENMKVLR